MIIEEKALTHWIDHFFGYGSWHARTWFITHEDGGGDLPEEVAEKLNYFYKNQQQSQPTLCDIRHLYRHCSMFGQGTKTETFSNLYEYRFGEHAQLSSIWKNLIAFSHSFRDETVSDALDYQKKMFTDPIAQREAFIKLYPLPSPHNHAWYYSWLDMPQLSFLKSRAMYQEHLYENRVKSILQNMVTNKPELVLMYGMENINALKKSVQFFFPEAKFKSNKATKLQIPQHHRADFNGTSLIITTQIPTLRHNRVETGFDWQEFGKKAREEKYGDTK
jgi:hypothetical protein